MRAFFCIVFCMTSTRCGFALRDWIPLLLLFIHSGSSLAWAKRSRRYSSSESTTVVGVWSLVFLVMRRDCRVVVHCGSAAMPYPPRVTLFTLAPFLSFFSFLSYWPFSYLLCLFISLLLVLLWISSTNLSNLSPISIFARARKATARRPLSRYVVAAGCIFLLFFCQRIRLFSIRNGSWLLIRSPATLPCLLPTISFFASFLFFPIASAVTLRPITVRAQKDSLLMLLL